MQRASKQDSKFTGLSYLVLYLRSLFEKKPSSVIYDSGNRAIRDRERDDLEEIWLMLVAYDKDLNGNMY